MSIGQDEDTRAFEEWLGGFYIQHPKFPEELMKAGLDEARQTWLMRSAFDAGVKRGEEKCGCCHGTAECGGRR
jgi:hypothetical protein